MDDRQLRYFLAVAKTLNFTHAAAALNISQPPLTQQIQRLEAELGAKLFQRTTRYVKLTAVGEALLREGTLALGMLDGLETAVRRTMDGERGRLAIGFVQAAMCGVLPKVITAFLSAYPEVEISFRELTSTQQFDAFAKGAIDIGIVRQPPSGIGAEYQHIGREALVLVSARTHRLAHLNRPIRLKEVAEEGFIAMKRSFEPGLHDAIVQACERAGFRMRVVQRASQILTVLALASEGYALAFGTRAVMSSWGPRLAILDIAEEDRVDADLYVMSRGDEAIPLVGRFLSALREHIGDHPTG